MKWLHRKRPKRRLAVAMQIVLIGMFLVGVTHRNVSVIVNSAIGVVVSFLPAILQRDYGLPMNPGLTLWITAAVFFHALGTVAVPGSGVSFYQSFWWWDHLTHALSASVVAAVGYTTVRAIDLHTEQLSFPPQFMVVFTVLFVVAFGVLWEILEFLLGIITPLYIGGSILTQYGLTDTMMDLIFDAVGGLIVGLWGSASLSGLTDALVEKLDRR